MADFPDSTIDRKTLLPQLFPNPENYLLLAGLAGTAKDSAAWTQEADNLITLGGAMGAAVSMGLGMALSAPDRGQPGHTSRRTDLAKMAEGAGIPSVMTISSPDEIPATAKFLTDTPAPRFLCARVMPGAPTAYKRNWDLAECRLRFKRALSGT